MLARPASRPARSCTGPSAGARPSTAPSGARCPCGTRCSMIALIGAKPVPQATNTIGLALSSRRKKLPSGPSRRRMSRSFILPNTWSVKLPPGTWRTCSSTSSSACGGLRHREAAPLAVLQQEVDVLAGEELQPLVRRQLELHDHHVVGDAAPASARGTAACAPRCPSPRRWCGLDHQLAERLRLAEERLALRALRLGEHARVVVRRSRRCPRRSCPCSEPQAPFLQP